MAEDDDCPLHKESLGYHTWNLLHTMVAYYPNNPSPQNRKDIDQFFTLLGRLYPCQACAHDFAKLIAAHPPITHSQDALSKWLCWIHNQVNLKIGKPMFDCNKVNERWRDGWNDGSCD